MLLGLVALNGCVEVSITAPPPPPEACVVAPAEAAQAQTQAAENYQKLWEAKAAEYRSGACPLEALLDPLEDWQTARLRHRQMTTPGVDWTESSVTELWWSWLVAAHRVQLLAERQKAGNAGNAELLEARAEAAEAKADYLSYLATVADVATFTELAKQGEHFDWMKPEEIAKVLDAMFRAEYGVGDKN